MDTPIYGLIAAPDVLLSQADTAMYEAKEAGKNGWRLRVLTEIDLPQGA